jgi:hypothetical protein
MVNPPSMPPFFYAHEWAEFQWDFCFGRLEKLRMDFSAFDDDSGN